MKITLDIPDTTLCAFFDFIVYDHGTMTMQGDSIDTDEMYNGSVIKIELRKKGDEHENQDR